MYTKIGEILPAAWCSTSGWAHINTRWGGLLRLSLMHAIRVALPLDLGSSGGTGAPHPFGRDDSKRMLASFRLKLVSYKIAWIFTARPSG